jgi:Tol biopolymer transport system component/DNA-binding winged helix-turn-helix (wHTH) protein
MSQLSKLPQILRFGVFQLDVWAGELHKNGVKLKLQDQPFKVLCLLLERPSEVVSREEIRNRLWPADTFVDFDHGLNAAIKRLRDALGDSADTPVFIETLARRGYRFIAPVEGGGVAGGQGVATAPGEGSSSFLRPWVVVAILICTGMGVLIWQLWEPSQRPKEVVEQKLTTNSSENSVSSAAISPDGKYLAYADSTGLYLKQIRTGETHGVSLPPKFSASVDDWFPDGSHLLVTSDEHSDKPSLWSISVFGGIPRQLAADAGGGSLSPDGSHIAFQRQGRKEEWVMESDGANAIKIAADKSSWAGWPTWSSDGTRISYVRMAESYNTHEGSLEINDWRHANAQTLLSNSALGPSVYWLPNGQLIYTLGDEGNQQGASLWAMLPEQSGKPTKIPKRVTRGLGWISRLSGTDDGKVLTFLRENTVASVYLGTLAPGGTRLMENRRLTLDENQDFPFAWTPDSKNILFNSNRNGIWQIFKQAADQSLAEILVTSNEQLSQPRLTPDGSEILYISTPQSGDASARSSIFAIPVAGGIPRLVLQDSQIWNVQCARLSSGFCLYSVSRGQTNETYRFDLKSGKNPAPPQLDSQCNWSLSPDASQRAMVCDNPDGIIQLRSTRNGESRELKVKGWNELDSIEWAVDGKSLLVTWRRGLESALLNVKLDGNVSVLFRSTNLGILGAIPSPDGRSVAIAATSTSRNVWRIENF